MQVPSNVSVVKKIRFMRTKGVLSVDIQTMMSH